MDLHVRRTLRYFFAVRMVPSKSLTLRSLPTTESSCAALTEVHISKNTIEISAHDSKQHWYKCTSFKTPLIQVHIIKNTVDISAHRWRYSRCSVRSSSRACRRGRLTARSRRAGPARPTVTIQVRHSVLYCRVFEVLSTINANWESHRSCI